MDLTESMSRAEQFKEVCSIFRRLSSVITGSFDVEYRLFFFTPLWKGHSCYDRGCWLAIRGSQCNSNYWPQEESPFSASQQPAGFLLDSSLSKISSASGKSGQHPGALLKVWVWVLTILLHVTELTLIETSLIQGMNSDIMKHDSTLSSFHHVIHLLHFLPPFCIHDTSVYFFTVLFLSVGIFLSHVVFRGSTWVIGNSSGFQLECR